MADPVNTPPAPTPSPPASDRPTSLGAAIFGPSGPLQAGQRLGPTPGTITGGQAVSREPAQVTPGAPRAAPTAAQSTAPAAQPQPPANSMYGKAGAPVAPPGQPAAPENADTPFDVARIALPEGYEPVPEVLGEFGNVANELKLNQKSADRLVALHAQATEAAIAKQAETWAAESHQHFGESLTETVGLIRDRIGNDADSKEFLNQMARTGLGSNRAVLSVLAKLARGR